MSSVDVLNQLLVIHNRSLPVYLRDASPWMTRADDNANAVLQNIATSNSEFADRFGEMVVAEGGIPAHGEFPMPYTALHDCGLGFLMRKVQDSQIRDIEIIERCVGQLDNDPLGKALAQESLGAARAHLDAVEEVV